MAVRQKRRVTGGRLLAKTIEVRSVTVKNQRGYQIKPNISFVSQAEKIGVIKRKSDMALFKKMLPRGLTLRKDGWIEKQGERPLDSFEQRRLRDRIFGWSPQYRAKDIPRPKFAKRRARKR